MKDVAKKDLNIGDDVVFIMPGFLFLRVGKIVDFTPKRAKIEYDCGDGDSDIINRPSEQVAKI